MFKEFQGINRTTVIVILACFLACWMQIASRAVHAQINDVGDVGCPEGTYRHDDYCYMVSSNFVTYEDAQMICKAGRGILAPVKTSHTEDFLQKLRIRKFLHRYWFGLDDKRSEGDWMHADGTRLSGGFTRWTRGEPNNLAKTQHCAYMWLERHLEWDDEDCARKFLYACQYDEVNCTGRGLPRHGRFCYELSQDIATYDEADLECHERGGILATLKTAGTFNFIKSIVYADRFWLNMSAKQMQHTLREQSNKASWILDTWIGVWHMNGEWLYSDGSVAHNYTNWAPGEPYSVRNAEDCVKLGQMWHDVQCDLRHGFICRYSPAINESSSTPQDGNIHCASEAERQRQERVQEPNQLESRSSSSAMRDVGGLLDASRDRNLSGVHLGIAELSYTITGCILLGMLIASVIILTLNWHNHRKNSSRRMLRADDDLHEEDLEMLREPEN